MPIRRPIRCPATSLPFHVKRHPVWAAVDGLDHVARAPPGSDPRPLTPLITRPLSWRVLDTQLQNSACTSGPVRLPTRPSVLASTSQPRDLSDTPRCGRHDGHPTAAKRRSKRGRPSHAPIPSRGYLSPEQSAESQGGQNPRNARRGTTDSGPECEAAERLCRAQPLLVRPPGSGGALATRKSTFARLSIYGFLVLFPLRLFHVKRPS